MSLNSIPKDLSLARACLVGSLIKNFEQFESDGCDNCESLLSMKNNRGNVIRCTSPNFDGIIALMSPDESWIAKWKHINNFTKGIYAISVSGRLPSKLIKEMKKKKKGIDYRSRDSSFKMDRNFRL